MKRQTVILAAGDFPRKGGAAWRLLAGARRVVACDSAASAYRRHFGTWPAVLIGDLDSLDESVRAAAARGGCTVVRVAEQETNDLEKAMAFCAARGWKDPVVVGATGKREDHTIGNVFRALDGGCEIVTDAGRFIPCCGRLTLHLEKGAAVSIFAPDPHTRMTSKGLAWPLDNVKFRNLYCATLNRATAARVTISSTKPTYIYIER